MKIKNILIGTSIVISLIIVATFFPFLKSENTNVQFSILSPLGQKQQSKEDKVSAFFYKDGKISNAGNEIKMIQIGVNVDKENPTIECAYLRDAYEVKYYKKERLISFLPFWNDYKIINSIQKPHFVTIDDQIKIGVSNTVSVPELYKNDVFIMRVFYNENDEDSKLYCVVNDETPYDFDFVPNFEWRQTPLDEFPGLLCDFENFNICFQETENEYNLRLIDEYRYFKDITLTPGTSGCIEFPVSTKISIEVYDNNEFVDMYEYTMSECVENININLQGLI